MCGRVQTAPPVAVWGALVLLFVTNVVTLLALTRLNMRFDQVPISPESRTAAGAGTALSGHGNVVRALACRIHGVGLPAECMHASLHPCLHQSIAWRMPTSSPATLQRILSSP